MSINVEIDGQTKTVYTEDEYAEIVKQVTELTTKLTKETESKTNNLQQVERLKVEKAELEKTVGELKPISEQFSTVSADITNLKTQLSVANLQSTYYKGLSGHVPDDILDSLVKIPDWYGEGVDTAKIITDTRERFKVLKGVDASSLTVNNDVKPKPKTLGEAIAEEYVGKMKEN